MNILTKHGAIIRGLLMAFVAGVVPVVPKLFYSKALTAADFITVVVAGLASMGAFLDQSNAGKGNPMRVWLRGSLYVLVVVGTEVVTTLANGKPFTWSVFVAVCVPTAFIAIRNFMDKSLSLVNVPHPATGAAS